MQKNVVIKLRTENMTGRHILAGILKRISDDRNRCTIHITSDTEDFRRLSISASAIIADTTADADILQTAIAGGKTVVLLNDWRFKDHPPNLGHIRTDDGEIGFKAADYFLSIGRFRSFGYVPYRESEKEWSIKRRRAFALRLKGKGHECHTFGMDGDGNHNLGRWLKALPKPAAVLCAWDAVAAETANAARKAKIHIPSQIVLLGVDNDEVHCTSSQPQISSIEFDAEREGFTAADLMLKMLDTRKRNVSRSICCGGVTRIVERESTRPPVPAAHLIKRALKFISENAVKGIGPKDVAAHLGISRTLLDLRFREMETKTVGELITERRLAILSSMLLKSKISASRLTKECGFGNINHAKAVFKKRFGMTMREWRRKNQS
ncbi:MAG: substrate-binding domain-containing protein [Kiritimatiellae bacterium]|nr:substrate-binding domain-containing protein [Kiritimatiellia bacterium]